MRTVLTGCGLALVAGVFSGSMFWSDVTAATMAKTPRLEVAHVEDADYAHSALGEPADLTVQPVFDLRPALADGPVVETSYPALPSEAVDDDPVTLDHVAAYEPADAPGMDDDLKVWPVDPADEVRTWPVEPELERVVDAASSGREWADAPQL